MKSYDLCECGASLAQDARCTIGQAVNHRAIVRRATQQEVCRRTVLSALDGEHSFWIQPNRTAVVRDPYATRRRDGAGGAAPRGAPLPASIQSIT